MGKKKVGLLLRSYAKKPEDVSSVVARAVKSVTNASGLLDSDGDELFQAVIVLVPRDYDCGKTAKAIQKEFKLFEDYAVSTIAIEASGHHSCGALNAGITIYDLDSFDYAVIVSNKAIEALTTDTMDAMLRAFDCGAKVVGVVVDELRDVVLEGRIQNTFAGWDIRSLQEVGGFDSEKGVEEIAPTVRLIQKYGPCISVLDPKEKPALDIRKSADGKARHDEVMTTKLERQKQEVERVGASFDFIRSGIMDGYPRSV